MANMKQQIKRYKNDNKKRAINAAAKSALRTEIKKVLATVESGDKEAAQKAYSAVTKKLDMAASKGLYHKNYANRQKSRLAKKVNSI